MAWSDHEADTVRDALALYRAALSDSGVTEEEYQVLLDNLADPAETRALLLVWVFSILDSVTGSPGVAAGMLAGLAERHSPVDVRESIREWQSEWEQLVAGGSA